MNWAQEAGKRSIFDNAAKVYALETKSLEPGQENTDAFEALVSDFLMTRGGFDQYATPEQAMTAFHTWLVGRKDAAARVGQPVKIGVHVTHHYGNRTVTMVYEELFQADNPFQRAWAFEECRRIVDTAHADYARTVGQQPQQQQPSNNGAGGDVDIFDGVRIGVDMKDGKKSFKVYGGRWQKFGVAIYPEVLKAAFPDREGIPPEGLPLNGRKCHAIMKDGKPVKIIRID